MHTRIPEPLCKHLIFLELKDVTFVDLLRLEVANMQFAMHKALHGFFHTYIYLRTHTYVGSYHLAKRKDSRAPFNGANMWLWNYIMHRERSAIGTNLYIMETNTGIAMYTRMHRHSYNYVLVLFPVLSAVAIKFSD